MKTPGTYACASELRIRADELGDIAAERSRIRIETRKWLMSITKPQLISSFPFVRVRQVPDRALVNRAAGRLGHPASIPRAIMSSSPEALAFGSRRHFIPASLSLPLCGCLLNPSRDCSRLRVPPRFPPRRYADAPAAASLCYLRFASAGSRRSPVRTKIGGSIRGAIIVLEPQVAACRVRSG
jgi:hypothetical protein